MKQTYPITNIHQTHCIVESNSSSRDPQATFLLAIVPIDSWRINQSTIISHQLLIILIGKELAPKIRIPLHWRLRKSYHFFPELHAALPTNGMPRAAQESYIPSSFAVAGGSDQANSGVKCTLKDATPTMKIEFLQIEN